MCVHIFHMANIDVPADTTSRWGMDHLLQVGIGYYRLDKSQESTYLYFRGLFILASCHCLLFAVMYFNFVINFSITIQRTLTDRLSYHNW